MSFNSDMTNLADAIRAKSGVSGKLTIAGMTDAVDAIEIGGSGGGGSGTFDLAKVTAYSPYAPAMTSVTSVDVSGIEDLIWSDDPESEDYEYNLYYSDANGTYNVTSETAGETDWRKRVYKHESKDYWLYYEYYEDYPEDSTWFFSTSPDSDGQFIRKYNEWDWETDEAIPVGDLESGEAEWGDYDWEPFYVTLNVHTTAIPETPMVLKGVLATGYTDGEWSFATAEKSFTGFEYTPSVGNLYATNGNTLIGMSIGVPGGILYLRFRIDKIRGTGEGVQFSEFLLFDKDGNPIFLNTLGVAEVSADAKNSSPSGEGPEKAFDGEISNGNSKWCSMPFNNPSWVQVKFRQPVVIADYPQYGWYTANDSTGRDPVSWSVLVSTDGVAWTPISVVDSYATPTARGVLAGKWEF